MRRKRLALLSLTIILLASMLIVVYALGNNPTQPPEEIPPANSLNDEIPDLIFVVPETPIGTLGLLGAMAIALGIFATIKTKRVAK